MLEGPFKARQDAHAAYLMSIEPDRMVAPFRIEAGLPAKAERYGGWESRDISGHSMGHYLSALALLYASTGSDAVRERIAYVVDELGACQQADGYLLPVEKRAFEELRRGLIEASPFSLNGVWVPNYTLHKVLAGLRDAWRLAALPKALEIERGLCDWLAGVLGGLDPHQVQRMLRAEHGGMNEVLADLSADTGDGRYLEMAAKYFHHDEVLGPMLRGEDRLDGLHGNTQIPKVIGLAREYELGADPQYRGAAETFWDNVVNRRSYAIGGHGESEHFFPPGQFPEKLSPYTCETCNTYNMLKLTGHLFAWRPDAARMDFVERALINHLLANIGRGPGEFGYFLGLGSVGVKVFSTPFDSWWCCVGTGLENPARYGEQIYFQDANSLWVNLYMGSVLTWPEKGLTLRQETRFPDEEGARFTFQCERPVSFALKLRHPSWCAEPVVRINGEPVAIASQPSTYIAIERTWRDGDTLELRLPMSLRAEPLPHSGGKIIAFMYGPIALAGIVPATPGVPDPAKERFSDHLKARGKTDEFPPLFIARDAAEALGHLHPSGRGFGEFISRGAVLPADIDFIPLHRIYEEHYAVYCPVMSAEEWAAREAGIRAERERQIRMEAATVDAVTPGYQQPEIEHRFQSERCECGDFNGRKWREAAGGWFSYEMAVDPNAPVALVATYWGGEWHTRNFDILVDGEKVGTQRLRTDHPGDFFDVTYPIPAELTRGKSKVTVRFQAGPGETAGRLFGLRVMRET